MTKSKRTRQKNNASRSKTNEDNSLSKSSLSTGMPQKHVTVRRLLLTLGGVLVGVIALLANFSQIATFLQAQQVPTPSPQLMTTSQATLAPTVRIAGEAFSKETALITGCRTSRNYYVEFYIANEFMVANIGARSISLISATLSRGDKRYKVKVFSPQSFDLRSRFEPSLDSYHGIVFGEGGWAAIIVPTEAQSLRLPQSIETGTAEKWMFQSEDILSFSTEQQAWAAIDEFKKGLDNVTWLFEFSDSSSLVFEKDIVSYSINPNLNKNFPICENG